MLSTPDNPPNQIFRILERPHLSGWQAGVEPGPPDYGRQNASGFLRVLLLLLLLLRKPAGQVEFLGNGSSGTVETRVPGGNRWRPTKYDGF